MKRNRLPLLLLGVISPILLQAGITGKLAGRVTDASTGDPLIGVNVSVEQSLMGAATDMDGYYRILNVLPGKYNLRVTMIGYKDIVHRDVKVLIDLTTTINFTLEISSLEGEEVIVYAAEPAVRLDVTSTSFKVGSDQIQQLQVENLSDIVELQAGVVEGHFRGGRAGEVMYIVDGIPMNDSYSGDNLFDIESDMIQEVDIISGIFNAEYGQAMSGIVNIVTKEGQDHYSGKLTVYAGDHLSSHDDIFLNIDHISPADITSYQASLSGPAPLLGDRLSFSILGRQYNDKGWMYGQRIFRPSDKSYFSDDTATQVFQATGDGEYVPMNPNLRRTVQGKLTYKISDRDKINFTGFFESEEHRDFDRLFKYNPDGNYHHFSTDYQSALQYTRLFGKNTFVNLNLSEANSEYSQYVYEDPFDMNYVPIENLSANNSNGYSTGGMRMWHHYRTNRTNILKGDLRSQISRVQTIGLGASYKSVRLWLNEFQLYFDENDTIRVPASTSTYNNDYVHYPAEISAYIQDKLELGEIFINVGLRYDYFDPDGVVPENFYNTVDAPKREAATSSQLSPRVGIAYPISDQGVIHFSYGHFFQIPNYEHLYINPDFEVSLVQRSGANPPRGSYNIMGNAELKPEKTVSYEIGLKQALSQDLTIDLTGYNKDIRDLIGQITLSTITGGRHWRYINRDYANVRGITVALEMLERPGGIGFSLDYTYQSASGNASDPLDESKNQETDPPIQSEKKRRPLNWDQTHSLNLTATTTQQGSRFSLIGKLGSGTPYTRESPFFNNRILNGERKPMTMTVNLNVTKDLVFRNFTMSVFLKVTNLFDRKNNKDVYASSGSADYDYSMIFSNYRGYGTQEEWYIQPNYYREVRKIVLGCSFLFDRGN
ncbi:MAG: TonB-dependent receptor [Candidatus Marinimicrobia bacterium]|nr:TonB-dependent receptor [Candidatus Neomarinimicrobiota bacterium]